jgi:hypothetical protein
MSHARDRYVNRTQENHRGNPHLEHRYYLDYLPYNFQKVRKTWRRAGTFGRRNGAFAQ